MEDEEISITPRTLARLSLKTGFWESVETEAKEAFRYAVLNADTDEQTLQAKREWNASTQVLMKVRLILEKTAMLNEKSFAQTHIDS